MSDDPVPSPPTPSPSTPSPPAIPGLDALDPTSRMIVGASVVALVVAVIGGVIRTWDSTDFLLLILAGSIATGATAWYTSTSSAGPKPSSLPLSTIECIGAAVVAVLGVWRTIELVFDIDQIDDLGGVVDLVAAMVLAGAGIVMLVGVLRRDPTIRSDAMSPDIGVRLAVGGLALVLLGWALNLSLGPWRMNAGTLSIALSTIAVIVIVQAPRWEATLPGIPIAWVGAAFGVVVAFLALGLWGELGRLGDEPGVELGLTDYVPFLIYVVGVVAIVAGGVLAGQAVWAKRPKPESAPATPAVPPAPAAPELPTVSSNTDDVSSTTFAASTPAYAAAEGDTPAEAASDPVDASFWKPDPPADDPPA